MRISPPNQRSTTKNFSNSDEIALELIKYPAGTVAWVELVAIGVMYKLEVDQKGRLK